MSRRKALLNHTDPGQMHEELVSYIADKHRLTSDRVREAMEAYWEGVLSFVAQMYAEENTKTLLRIPGICNLRYRRAGLKKKTEEEIEHLRIVLWEKSLEHKIFRKAVMQRSGTGSTVLDLESKPISPHGQSGTV